MIKKYSISFVLLSVLSICCILLGELRLWKTNDLIEYALPYSVNAQPANDADGRGINIQDFLEMKIQMQRASLSAAFLKRNSEISTENGMLSSCTLYGISGEWLEQHGETLIEGRDFTTEEQEDGKTVALVNQELARELWPEEMDFRKMNVIVEGRPYRVVGILKDSFTFCGKELYVPIKTVSELDLQWDIQILSAKNARMNIFKATVEEYMPGGSLYSLRRERVKAGLALRYTCVAILIFVLKYSFALIHHQILREWRKWKKIKERRYAKGMIIPGLLFISRVMLILASWGFVVVLTLRLAVYPVYVFPEFVPPIPVHVSEYIIQIREVLCNAIQASETATKAVAQIQVNGFLVTGGTFVFLLAVVLKGIRKKMKCDWPALIQQRGCTRSYTNSR